MITICGLWLVEANDLLSSNAQLIHSQTEKIAELEAQIAILKEQSDVMPTQTAAYEALLAGYVAYVGGDNTTAGSHLEKLDTTQLSEGALEIYNTVWTEIAEPYYATL